MTDKRAAMAELPENDISRPAGDSSTTTMDKPSRSLDSLNNQLMTHGWTKKAINLDALSGKDLVQVVGVMFELLGSSVANLSTLDNLNSRHRTLTYEHERLQKQSAAQAVARAKLEAETTAWKARCGDIERHLTMEREQVKELKEEISRSRKAMESVKLAAVHEAKKNQIKLDKAQQHLARLANDAAASSSRPGLILLNPVEGSRTAPTAPPQSVLVEQSVKDLAEIRENLQEEADAFRHVLMSTGNAMRDTIALIEGKEEPPRYMHSQFFSDPKESRTRSITMRSGPSTLHASYAETRLKSLISELGKKAMERNTIVVAAQSSPAGTDALDEDEEKRLLREREHARLELEDKIKDLEVEIACVKAREAEAHKVVEELSRVQAARETSPGESVTSELERAMLEEREMLNEERMRFTEAATRLSDERRQFEAERNAFLEERRQSDLDAIQGYLPSSPSESSSGSPASSSQSSRPTRPSEHHTEPLPNLLLPTLPTSPWTAHRPTCPSPLSAGHKPRTPKTHKVHGHATSSKKKVKTPLARLVLEKGLKSQVQVVKSHHAETTRTAKGPTATTATTSVRQSASANVNAAAASGVLQPDRGRGTNVKPGASNRVPSGATLGKAVQQGSGLVKPQQTSHRAAATRKAGEGLGVAAKGSDLPGGRKASTLASTSTGGAGAQDLRKSTTGTGRSTSGTQKGAWR